MVKNLRFKILIFVFMGVILSGFCFYYFSNISKAGLAKINTQQTDRLTSGLVGYYTMDGQDTNWNTQIMTDKSGAGNNGTITNMSTSTSPVSGVVGQALKFDGVNDNVIPSSSYNGVKTVSFWIKANTSASKRIVELDSSTRVETNSSSAVVATNFTGPTIYFDNVISAAPVVNTASWHHVVVATNTGVNATAINIGGSSSYFNGSIDEVRVYNRAITASEVSELYNQGAKRLLKANTQDTNRLTSGLVGYWTMDGQDTNWTSATAGTVLDKSGNNNSGAFVNMKQSLSPAPGVIGQGVNIWQGSSAYNEGIILGNPAVLNDLGSTTPITISAWVYPKVLGVFSGIYAVSNSNASNLIININNAVKYVRDYNTTDISRLTSTSVIKKNQWQHILVTWSGDVSGSSASNIHIYINGIEQSYQTTTNGVGGYKTDASLNKKIGDIPDSGGAFQGSIDEFRLYNRVLSQSEIMELYNQGAKRLLKANNPDTSRLTSGLVGYYTMDGQDTNWNTQTMTDKSGQGNNGTITNMSTSTSPVPGVVGQALKFDGTDDYIRIGDKLDPLSNISISAWFNEKAGVANNVLKSIVAKSFFVGPADAYALFFRETANILRFGVSNETVAVACDTTFDRASKQGTWHHVVGVYNGASVTAYIDNVQSTCSASLTGSVNNNTQNLMIGTDTTASSYFFDGSIDEVRIYNRALSASEVSELYRAGR